MARRTIEPLLWLLFSAGGVLLGDVGNDELVEPFLDRGGLPVRGPVDRVAQAGVLGLLGPNGSGKTTLMSIMATLLDPTSGTIQVDGRDG